MIGLNLNTAGELNEYFERFMSPTAPKRDEIYGDEDSLRLYENVETCPDSLDQGSETKEESLIHLNLENTIPLSEDLAEQETRLRK